MVTFIVIPVEIMESPRQVEYASNWSQPHLIVCRKDSHLDVKVYHNENLRNVLKDLGEQVGKASMLI